MCAAFRLGTDQILITHVARASIEIEAPEVFKSELPNMFGFTAKATIVVSTH
jgi:hypothetical protein